ncbi:MAG: signal peptide peptidase SppA [Bacteroidetes bacterium]|nr:MAG: signal peptide peptidase SppA [Bacteroidota bacterium]
MKNFLSSLLATITGLVIMTVLVFLIFMGIIAASTSKDPVEVKENSLLVAKFNAKIMDRANEDPFALLFSGNFMYDEIMGLNQILKDLDKAKTDDNIEGIFMRLGAVSAGIATLGEIREAMLDFKESGKFIYAYSDAYTQKSYYLASVADSVFMTPEGMFLFNGMSAEVMFYKDALEKVGVEMQVIRHGSYKGAVEPFLRNDLSPENREQIESYVGALWGKIVEDISVSRGMSVEKLNRIADDLSTIDSDQLVETGMIDGLIYYDEMLTLMKGKLGVEEEDDLEAVSLKSYKDAPVKEKKKYSKDKVAVIYAMGSVVDGNAGEGYISSERISKAIRKARRDKSVKAIVFRINSGGGSGSASDVIHREVMLAAKEKPVVASMGDVAASGGYYIAAPADTILASPGTITGSIGVFGLFPNVQKLMNDKIGVTTDVVKTNENSNILTAMDPLDPDERVIVQKMIDDFYVNFVNIVAEGRGKSYDEIDAIAGGRVWAGSNALELGLIDMYGGLQKSIEVAAEMAGLEDYRVQSLPRLEDPMAAIMKQLTGGSMVRTDRILQRELGLSYRHYRKIQDIQKMHGIQAIMPYEIELH